ncbi:Vps5 C terminal like [Musa troglodytarum]|uniref:Vps5 C terminal like n=1 Tax=Musa troglodytarum TaxID=320322 RepID=A0A9E7EJL7_9LILI|nr:Vps5 C terminal like [Musa troglodytarum]
MCVEENTGTLEIKIKLNMWALQALVLDLWVHQADVLVQSHSQVLGPLTCTRGVDNAYLAQYTIAILKRYINNIIHQNTSLLVFQLSHDNAKLDSLVLFNMYKESEQLLLS